jgi:hypothetical protein
MPIPSFREDGWLPVGHHRASWEEIVHRFQGNPNSRRSMLTTRLLELRDALRLHGVTGYLLLDGSYISAKPEPGDFDLLLVGPPDIQVVKDGDPTLAQLLDAERCEKVGGYSMFYIPRDSPDLGLLSTLWDQTVEGVAKGVIEVNL